MKKKTGEKNDSSYIYTKRKYQTLVATFLHSAFFLQFHFLLSLRRLHLTFPTVSCEFFATISSLYYIFLYTTTSFFCGFFSRKQNRTSNSSSEERAAYVMCVCANGKNERALSNASRATPCTRTKRKGFEGREQQRTRNREKGGEEGWRTPPGG